MWGEFCRTISQAHPLRRERHFGSNRKPTRWDRDSREMGMKKALPKECLVEMQNPTGGSHRGGPLRARRDSNPQPSEP